MDIVSEVYVITEKFPKGEIFGLVSQMRRCAVSIPSNIAEGRMRGTDKEFKQFLRIAYGSGSELNTQLEIAKRIGLISTELFQGIEGRLEEVMKMLNVFISKL